MIELNQFIQAAIGGAEQPPPPKAPGIYMVLNLKTGCAYIGKSVDLAQRWASHRQALVLGAHHCAAMQSDWTAQDGQGFAFRVIEEVPGGDPHTMSAKEIEYIAQMMGVGCYNRSSASLGRQATGQTPPAVRQAKAKAALRAAGGERITVNLSPEAMKDLHLVAATLTEGGTLATDRACIEHALQRTAALIRRARR